MHIESMAGRRASLSGLLPKPEGLRILVIGSGGREHAIVLHLLKSKRVEHVYVAPGNGGTCTIDAARCSNLANVNVGGDFSDICRWAQEKKVSTRDSWKDCCIADGCPFSRSIYVFPVQNNRLWMV